MYRHIQENLKKGIVSIWSLVLTLDGKESRKQSIILCGPVTKKAGPLKKNAASLTYNQVCSLKEEKKIPKTFGHKAQRGWGGVRP